MLKIDVEERQSGSELRKILEDKNVKFEEVKSKDPNDDNKRQNGKIEIIKTMRALLFNLVQLVWNKVSINHY